MTREELISRVSVTSGMMLVRMRGQTRIGRVEYHANGGYSPWSGWTILLKPGCGQAHDDRPHDQHRLGARTDGAPIA